MNLDWAALCYTPTNFRVYSDVEFSSPCHPLWRLIDLCNNVTITSQIVTAINNRSFKLMSGEKCFTKTSLKSSNRIPIKVRLHFNSLFVQERFYTNTKRLSQIVTQHLSHPVLMKHCIYQSQVEIQWDKDSKKEVKFLIWAQTSLN